MFLEKVVLKMIGKDSGTKTTQIVRDYMTSQSINLSKKRLNLLASVLFHVSTRTIYVS